MYLKKIDLAEKLTRYRAKANMEDQILQNVLSILQKDTLAKNRIEKNIATGKTTADNLFDFDALETQHIYHISQIRAICIDYRLRFLDSRYFKGVIPPEAISKIKQLEAIHQIEIKGFKIMAPSKLFKLDNVDDPLLFAPIGNGYYYLIHKWGNDLHPLRKLAMWPFKNVINLVLVLALGSYFISLAVPNGLFSKSLSANEFWIIFFFIFKSVVAVVLFYGCALGKNFNPAIWNSKYFNS
ncbi:hypothetical protein U1E44_14825 [Arenibacter sp. GZD96]|uniref:hypothetical protein n=1 Tax=Aurantibrevibacter litoralis TaxID=3106030 RepID=UPI002AFE43A4|nr:hypothetical protein [Arenibacter sp. GZD-96]MEA1787372.1 hypothetical protein [Arenibacter sp. GZD-96]